MCKAPKPPKPKEPKKPMFLKNRYLDEFVGDAQAVKSLRAGRSSLRIPLGGPAPIGGRQPGDSLVRQPNNVNPVRVRGGGTGRPIGPTNRPGEPRRQLR